jgi:hypothetical protein
MEYGGKVTIRHGREREENNGAEKNQCRKAAAVSKTPDARLARRIPTEGIAGCAEQAGV